MSFATAPVLVALVGLSSSTRFFNCAGATRNPKVEEDISVLEVSSTGRIEHFAPKSVETGSMDTGNVTAGGDVPGRREPDPREMPDGAIPKRRDPVVDDPSPHLKVWLVQQNAPPHGNDFAHQLITLGKEYDADVIVLTLQDFHFTTPKGAEADVPVNGGVAATMLPIGDPPRAEKQIRPFPSEAQFERTGEFEDPSSPPERLEFISAGGSYTREYLRIIDGDCKNIKPGDVVGPVALAVYVRTNVETVKIETRLPEPGRKAGKTCKGTMMARALFEKEGVDGSFHVVFGSTHGEDGVDEVALRMRYNTVKFGAAEMFRRSEGNAAILWGGDFNSRYVYRLPEVFKSGYTPMELRRVKGGIRDEVPVYMNMPRIDDDLEDFCEYGNWLDLGMPDKQRQWCMTAGLDRQANESTPCKCKLLEPSADKGTHHVHTTAWDTLQVKGAKTKGKRGLDALIVTHKDRKPFGLFLDSFVMCEGKQCKVKDEHLPRLELTGDVLGIDEGGDLASHQKALEEGSSEGAGPGWEMIPSGFGAAGGGAAGECLPSGSDPELCESPTFKIKGKSYEIGVSRPTSWPDRVMYMSGSHTKVAGMRARPHDFGSDHMSILAMFELEVV